MPSMMRRVCIVGLVAVASAACDREPTDPAVPNMEDDDEFRLSFILRPDVGGGTDFPCNLYTQNCPAGDKCMPWANDGGSAWNATRCSPVVDDPREVGMACTVEGSGVSGVDDCERGAMCFDVDPETGQGICYAMLVGSDANPLCVDRLQAPVISSTLSLCLPTCRPLRADCPPGHGLLPRPPTGSPARRMPRLTVATKATLANSSTAAAQAWRASPRMAFRSAQPQVVARRTAT